VLWKKGDFRDDPEKVVDTGDIKKRKKKGERTSLRNKEPHEIQGTYENSP